jgi:hypothetical protein
MISKVLDLVRNQAIVWDEEGLGATYGYYSRRHA